jgi:hypothetical protein
MSRPLLIHQPRRRQRSLGNVPGMILSVQRKFIFLKTSKTAGTSLEIALSKYALPDDIVTPINPVDEEIRRNLGHAGPQNYLAPPGLLQKLGLKRPEMKFYNHIRANLIREHLGHDVFATYLKVAVVRNPYDMAVSRYFWAHRNHAQLTEAHFRQWLLSRPKTLYKNYKITHIDGVSVIDLMIRYENFREDLEVFARRAGLPDTLRGFDEGKKVVEEMFAEDIETYGYKCP